MWGKKTSKPFDPASRGPGGSGEGLEWKLYPGIKRQRHRWPLKTAREDRRGPAYSRLCAQSSGSSGRCSGLHIFLLGLSTAGGRLLGVAWVAAERSQEPVSQERAGVERRLRPGNRLGPCGFN